MTTAQANFDKVVGAAMRQARKGDNPLGVALTLEKMAAKLRQRHVRVHQPDLSNYERGKDRPPDRVVSAYARVLGFNDNLAIYRRAFDSSNNDAGQLAGRPIRHYVDLIPCEGDGLVPHDPAHYPLAHAA